MTIRPERVEAGAPSAERFTVLDWIGTAVAASMGVGLLLFPFTGRTFASMFRDLGSAHELPLLTRLVIGGWFPVLLGLLVTVGVVAGARSTASLNRRRASIVGAFALGGLGLGLCVVGVWLPVFALADAVDAR